MRNHQKIIQFTFLLITFFSFAFNEPVSIAGEKTIDSSAIWKPGETSVDDMRNSCVQGEDCFVSKMVSAGAPAAAVDFTKYLLKNDYPFCYMSSFREMGKVDMALVDCPFMANTMGFTLLVNGNPQVLLPGDAKYLKKIDIKKDPLYKSIRKKYPRAGLWMEGDFVKLTKTLEGGQRFIWEHKLLNGCRACDVAGSATVSYDFDPGGKFIGVKLIRLNNK